MANDRLAEASRQLPAALKGARCRLLSLMPGALALLPPPAMADEIPFFVNNQAFQDVCLIYTGPWFRQSSDNGQEILANAGRIQFYSAEINLFSPFGLWNCWFDTGGRCGSKGPINNPFHFCVFADPDGVAPVELTLTVAGGQANYPQPPCNFGAAAAFLGDAASPGRDRDVFRFDGVAGDAITVRLERDGARGSSGKIAKLSLDAVGGGTLRAKEGAVPLEFKVSLPSTGNFALEATEVQDAAASFRGYYRLSVTSARGAQPLLKPAEATEP
jgi:hypothetical protein